jgi:hypothetical protein
MCRTNIWNPRRPTRFVTDMWPSFRGLAMWKLLWFLQSHENSSKLWWFAELYELANFRIFAAVLFILLNWRQRTLCVPTFARYNRSMHESQGSDLQTHGWDCFLLWWIHICTELWIKNGETQGHSSNPHSIGSDSMFCGFRDCIAVSVLLLRRVRGALPHYHHNQFLWRFLVAKKNTILQDVRLCSQ